MTPAAVDMLAVLRDDMGLTVTAVAGRLRISPASRLDELSLSLIREVRAELLALVVSRDRAADDRVSCIDCEHHRPGRCSSYRRAGLSGPDVGHDLAELPQWCPAFEAVR